MLAASPVLLGAQNCGWADGPWTGEVSPSLLAELDIRFVEIGHAERRRYFGEDSGQIARKVRAAVAAGLTPLLCVGEETGDGGAEAGATAAAAHIFQQVAEAVGPFR
jgi:triosephosphate isomerase